MPGPGGHRQPPPPRGGFHRHRRFGGYHRGGCLGCAIPMTIAALGVIAGIVVLFLL